MGKTNIALQINGTFFQIPLQGNVIFAKGDYEFSGRLILDKKTTITDCLSQMGDGNRIDAKIKSILPDWEIEEALVMIKSNEALLKLKVSGISVFYCRRGNGNLLLFDCESSQIPNDSVIKKFTQFLSIDQLKVIAAIGSERIAPPEWAASQLKLLPIPAQTFDSNSSLLLTRFVITDKSPVPIQALSKLIGLNELSLFIGVSRQEWCTVISLPVIDNQLMRATDLVLMLKVGKTGVSVGLQGGFDIKLSGKTISFYTACQLGTTSFFLSASQRSVSNQTASIAIGRMQLSNMALSIGYSLQGFQFAVCCRITLKKINLFGAIALGYSGILRPHLFSIALSDLTLKDVIESVADIEIPVQWLNEFAIRGIKIEGQRLPNTTFRDSDIPAWGSMFRQSIGDQNTGGGEKDFTYMTKSNGDIVLTDKAYMRHYCIMKSGGALQVQAEAQFLIADEDITLGEYHVTKGCFLCATIQILNLKVALFLNVIPGVSVIGCVRIAPFSNAFISIGASDYNSSTPKVSSPPALVASMMKGATSERGAICYFEASKAKGVNFFLDAKIKLLSAIEFQTRIILTKGLVSINASGNILNLFRYALKVECSYGDFNNMRFMFILVVDTSGLKDKFNQVRRRIESARNKVSEAQRRVNDKFYAAKSKVDSLQNEINNFDRQISDKKYDLKHSNIFKKIKIAFQITGLEIARAAVWCAMKVARGVLDVAQRAANLAMDLSKGVLDMVNIILKGVLDLFYINRFTIAVDLKKKPGFLFNIDFVIFGKNYNLEYNAGSRINVVGELDSAMCNKSDNDLRAVESGMQSKEAPIEEVEIEYSLDQLAESMKQGGNSVRAGRETIQELLNIYRSRIDGEIDLSEKEELQVAYIESLQGINEYVGVSSHIGSSADEALSVISEADIPEPKGDPEEKQKLDDFIQAKEQLATDIRSLQDANIQIKEEIERSIDIFSGDLATKDRVTPKNKIENPDWDGFVDSMHEVLVKKAQGVQGNFFTNIGYEQSIHDALDENATIVKKSHIQYAPSDYTPKL